MKCKAVQETTIYPNLEVMTLSLKQRDWLMTSWHVLNKIVVKFVEMIQKV